ncbi:hypothetical protein AGLY_016654 [Aphis glycines]|uniref:THAP-type domain-containing protein n=1 Tax=Aphis glycines TaxID=307491 RepID=A0A6G0SXD0_APHGL|nr:hypothetical protein AGLY_016654 [Aphis glycines]
MLCTSGYKSNTEKVHQFCVPKNEDIRMKWAKAIPRQDLVFTKNTYVCAKHFIENDIIKFWSSGAVKISYKQRRFVEGVIPTIFYGPSYLSKKYVKPRKIRKSVDHPVLNILFKNLFQCVQTIQFKSPRVALPITKDDIEFKLVTFNIGKIEKCVKVNQQNQISFWISGKKIKNNEINILPALNIKEFIGNIQNFESIIVCNGGPEYNLFSDAPQTICNVSSNNLLRHNNCNIMITSKAKCCEQKKIGCEELLVLSPRKKKMVDVIRKKNYSLQRNLVNDKKKINELNIKLIKAQEDMALCNQESIQEKLRQLNDSQKTLVNECLAASKLKNPKSRRYSDNWLIESALLPFPHPKTVRQHLASIKTTCDQISEINKHGILLFDAINLRKSLSVNSSNLTYTGLEDYGDERVEGACHKEFADHALVFMWQSLSSNFCQTIGCFASKGEVKGVIIAQLVLKAITLLENIGIFVDGIISDGASTNRRMWKELGIDGSRENLKKYFVHLIDSERKVFVLSDFVHLFKCIRSRLHNNKSLQLHSKANQICWDYYKEVYKEDVKNPGNLRIIPRITPHHLE